MNASIATPYREFRLSPPCKPYKFAFLHYIGSFTVKQNSKLKVWLFVFYLLVEPFSKY